MREKCWDFRNDWRWSRDWWRQCRRRGEQGHVPIFHLPMCKSDVFLQFRNRGPQYVLAMFLLVALFEHNRLPRASLRLCCSWVVGIGIVELLSEPLPHSHGLVVLCQKLVQGLGELGSLLSPFNFQVHILHCANLLCKCWSKSGLFCIQFEA